MPPFISIEYEPTKMGRSGQRYRVFHDGCVLVESTKDAPHDAARALVALGADINATLLCFQVGDPNYRLRGRLGYFAGTRTAEGEYSGPRTVGWVPYTGPVLREDDE